MVDQVNRDIIPHQFQSHESKSGFKDMPGASVEMVYRKPPLDAVSDEQKQRLHVVGAQASGAAQPMSTARQLEMEVQSSDGTQVENAANLHESLPSSSTAVPDEAEMGEILDGVDQDLRLRRIQRN